MPSFYSWGKWVSGRHSDLPKVTQGRRRFGPLYSDFRDGALSTVPVHFITIMCFRNMSQDFQYLLRGRADLWTKIWIEILLLTPTDSMTLGQLPNASVFRQLSEIISFRQGDDQHPQTEFSLWGVLYTNEITRPAYIPIILTFNRLSTTVWRVNSEICFSLQTPVG